jgi:hypothetical protein
MKISLRRKDDINFPLGTEQVPINLLFVAIGRCYVYFVGATCMAY